MNIQSYSLLAALLAGCCAAISPAHSGPLDIAPTPGVNAIYDLCARGLSGDETRPFAKTARVQLSLRGGIPSAPTLTTVQAELIRQALWPEQASRVYVEDFDARDCQDQSNGIVELTVDIRGEGLAEVESRITRGDLNLGAMLRSLVRRIAISRAGIAKSGESGPTTWLRLFYATNRQLGPRKDDTTLVTFGSDRVDKLSYGDIEVGVQSQAHMQDNETSAVHRVEKVSALESFFVRVPPRLMERDAWLTLLRRKAEKFEKPGVLLFIHGYNVDFLSAARRAAQLTYDLAFQGPTVFLAWPSDSATLSYLRDGRDAENSWPAATRVLSDLVEALPTGPIYVVAHSMGNRVLLGGLAALLDESTSSRRAFREVVMAAPDVDQDYYRINWSKRVQNRGPRLTLYASSHDLALGSSEFLHGGVRMGMGGDALYLDPDVDSIDASRVAREFFGLNHSYFGDSQSVLSDVYFLIRYGMAVDKRPHLKRVGTAPPYRWELR